MTKKEKEIHQLFVIQDLENRRLENEIKYLAERKSIEEFPADCFLIADNKRLKRSGQILTNKNKHLSNQIWILTKKIRLLQKKMKKMKS